MGRRARRLSAGRRALNAAGRSCPSLIAVLAALLALAAVAGCQASGRGSSSGRTPRPAQPLRGVWHEVSAGETLEGLARRYRVPAEDIEEINGLDRDAALASRRVIFVPGAGQGAAGKAAADARRATQARAVPGTTADGEAGAGGAPARRQVGARADPDEAGGSGTSAASSGSSLLWPVPHGKVVSPFGPRGKRPHEGVDIAAPEGTAVLAAAAGLVIYSGAGVRGYGNLILLRHEGGLVTVYAHNRRNLVEEGARVQRGQVIAEVGQTGNATASHLHFEVRRGEAPVDPLDHLPPR